MFGSFFPIYAFLCCDTTPDINVGGNWKPEQGEIGAEVEVLSCHPIMQQKHELKQVHFSNIEPENSRTCLCHYLLVSTSVCALGKQTPLRARN